jgi:hypothetical protein
MQWPRDTEKTAALVCRWWLIERGLNSRFLTRLEKAAGFGMTRMGRRLKRLARVDACGGWPSWWREATRRIEERFLRFASRQLRTSEAEEKIGSLRSE